MTLYGRPFTVGLQVMFYLSFIHVNKVIQMVSHARWSDVSRVDYFDDSRVKSYPLDNLVLLISSSLWRSPGQSCQTPRSGWRQGWAPGRRLLPWQPYQRRGQNTGRKGKCHREGEGVQEGREVRRGGESEGAQRGWEVTKRWRNVRRQMKEEKWQVGRGGRRSHWHMGRWGREKTNKDRTLMMEKTNSIKHNCARIPTSVSFLWPQSQQNIDKPDTHRHTDSTDCTALWKLVPTSMSSLWQEPAWTTVLARLQSSASPSDFWSSVPQWGESSRSIKQPGRC